MQLTINGAPKTVEATSLAALLNELGYSGTVATAVNEAFVPGPARAGHRLRDGDRVEILAPMQGG